MQASVGVSAGPVRVSQGLPGFGGILAAAPIIGLLVFGGWILGFTNESETSLPDGHYYVGRSAPKGSKVDAGMYHTTTPKKATDDHFNDGKCKWWVMDRSGTTLREGEPKAGKKVSTHLANGENFMTANCGTWEKGPA